MRWSSLGPHSPHLPLMMSVAHHLYPNWGSSSSTLEQLYHPSAPGSTFRKRARNKGHLHSYTQFTITWCKGIIALYHLCIDIHSYARIDLESMLMFLCDVNLCLITIIFFTFCKFNGLVSYCELSFRLLARQEALPQWSISVRNITVNHEYFG